MAKNNIAIGTWEKMSSNETVDVKIKVDGEEVFVTVTPTLSFQDAATMIDYIAQVVLDDETGEYHPEVLNVLFRAQVLERYAGFKMPKSFDKIYTLAYTTDAYSLVKAVVNRDQLYDIENAIYEIIEYRKGVLANGIQAELQKTVNVFTAFSERTEEMLEKVDGVDIGNFVKSVSSLSESLDEENLVKAVREARAENGDQK